jgi:hypothetical protein
MKYIDARTGGGLPQFLDALHRELRASDEIRLTGREWLARDDFRRDLEALLRACAVRGVRVVR